MKNILTILFITVSVMGKAQSDSSSLPLTVSGYVEIYYNYDFNKPGNHTLPTFLYSYNRHNEVNLNLGFIKLSHQKNNTRANLAVAAGTYINANYSAEPGVLKNIYEANAGVKLSKKKSIWLDAGIFASHIGFESATGKDNWTLSRSILAENSPYFETGVKLSYTSPDKKWFISGLILNGWQRIQRPAGNNSIAVGHQLTFKPSSKIALNSSSFIGNDKPDSTKQMRYFHNLYGTFQLTNKLLLTAGFDIGAEQKSKRSKQYNNWYSPVVILKLSADSRNSIAARLEYYNDANGVIIPSNTANGFKTWSYSLNYDRAIKENMLWRIEVRGFKSKDKIFEQTDKATNTDFILSTALAISF